MEDTEYNALEHQRVRGTCNHGVAILEISRAHELLRQLQALLLQRPARPGGWPQGTAGDNVRESLRFIESALSALRSGAGAAERDERGRECARRPSSRKSRSKVETWSILTNAPYVDGYEWKKYGKKIIHNAKYPRSYYRCTFKEERGCMAKKTVQQEDSDGGTPSFTVEYSAEHTCNRGFSETPIPFVFESSFSSEQACPVPLHGLCGGTNSNNTSDSESLQLLQDYEPQILYTDLSSNPSPPENSEMDQGGEVGGAPAGGHLQDSREVVEGMLTPPLPPPLPVDVVFGDMDVEFELRYPPTPPNILELDGALMGEDGGAEGWNGSKERYLSFCCELDTGNRHLLNRGIDYFNDHYC